ncbi:hypothetical protein [Pedobacter jejuensis]|uniref:Uncharacterized protein n=1 Tax=Pedobacter jejuensis TaxID=1268550 RepID=A0A3N0BZX9_9SPHI|nr:hypothetical protein [Pedobacter jejuensis]RNL55491.1 hypothetical protein D7004_04050 [Pedobacter jejuensis]
MKNLKLENLGVQKMEMKEMKELNGGSWLSRAFDTVVDALEDVYDWALSHNVKLGAGKQSN